MQRMGRMMPVEGLAPKTIAMMGTDKRLIPWMPVFDIPMSRAEKKNQAHSVGV